MTTSSFRTVLKGLALAAAFSAAVPSLRAQVTVDDRVKQLGGLAVLANAPSSGYTVRVERFRASASGL